MADDKSMSLREAVGKVMSDEHADVLRESVALVVREVMQAEVGALAGADRYARSPERVTHRNGYRARQWDTRVGTIELAIPRLRTGLYLPSFLEPRRRSEQALVAVVQEAYVNGVSTRKVERLVEQLGVASLSTDQVSRMCALLDEQVRVFRARPLEGRYPYLWLDAKVERVREPGGVRHKCLVIAYAVHESGRREVIGLDVGEAETEAFWREFLRALAARGLTGVELVTSDAHPGLKAAINTVLGCPWQRCTVHFLRDMLGHVAKTQQQMVGAAIRQIFACSTRQEAHEVLGEVVERLAGPAPKVARLLEEAEPDLLAFLSFPAEHHTKLRSTNPLERVNREIGRRSDVVGISPNDAALLRLASMLLIEQTDEWLVGRRYLSQEPIALVYVNPGRPSGPGEADQPALAGSAGRPRSRTEAIAAEPDRSDDPDLHHVTRLDLRRRCRDELPLHVDAPRPSRAEPPTNAKARSTSGRSAMGSTGIEPVTSRV